MHCTALHCTCVQFNGALSGLGTDLWQEMSKALEREKAMLTACSLLQEYRYCHATSTLDHTSSILLKLCPNTFPCIGKYGASRAVTLFMLHSIYSSLQCSEMYCTVWTVLYNAVYCKLYSTL